MEEDNYRSTVCSSVCEISHIGVLEVSRKLHETARMQAFSCCGTTTPDLKFIPSLTVGAPAVKREMSPGNCSCGFLSNVAHL